MTYTPLPKPSYVDQLTYVGYIGGRRRWRDDDGNIYTYDGTHSELEMFNRRGAHLGAVDVHTGQIIKPAKRGRRIDV